MRIPKVAAVAMLLAAAVAAPSAGQFAISTTYLSDNGAAGNMFDVETTSFGGGVRITGVDINAEFSVFDAEVWVVTGGGTFVGHQSTPGDWTLVGSATAVHSNGDDRPTPLPIALDVSIPPGQTLGLYVTTTAVSGIKYTNGSDFGGTAARDRNLIIHEGVGKDYPFGTTYGGLTAGGPSRIWNGTIHYSTPSCDTATPLTTLSTGFAANLGQDGAMFDIDATTDVVVRGIDLHLVGGTVGVEVYVVTGGGTFVGKQDDPSAWTLAGAATLTAAGVGVPTPFPLLLDVAISAGSTLGFYVTTTTGLASVRYNTSNDFGAPAASNSDIAINEGLGKSYPFGSNFGTPVPGGPSRIWNGNVHYFLTDGGQASKPGVASFDAGFALSTPGLPVCSGTPGPYFSSVEVGDRLLLRFEGEPGQPILFLTGNINVGSVAFPPFGQLDIGSFNSGTGMLEGVGIVADGTQPGPLSSLFLVLPGGRTDMSFGVPPLAAGLAVGFQSIIFNTAEVIGISNAVEVSFVP